MYKYFHSHRRIEFSRNILLLSPAFLRYHTEILSKFAEYQFFANNYCSCYLLHINAKALKFSAYLPIALYYQLAFGIIGFTASYHLGKTVKLPYNLLLLAMAATVIFQLVKNQTLLLKSKNPTKISSKKLLDFLNLFIDDMYRRLKLLSVEFFACLRDESDEDVAFFQKLLSSFLHIHIIICNF